MPAVSHFDPPSGTSRTHELVDSLVASGLLAVQHVDEVLARVERNAEPLLDAILDLGLVGEVDLLRHIASQLRTRFVSSDKLARAAVPKGVLERLPRTLLERLRVFPILFDGQTLSIVAADPTATELRQTVGSPVGARSVVIYVARPAAVEALIRKHCYGDQQAFSAIGRGPRTAGGRASMPGARQAGFGHAGSGTVAQPARTQDALLDLLGGGAPAAEAAPPVEPAPPPQGPSIDLPPLDIDPIATPAVAQPAGVSFSAHLEALNVLVTLLEQGRDGLRGHSSEVVRTARRVALRMGLDEPTVNAIAIAGYIHDLGKLSNYHLTPFNVAHFDGHRAQAQKVYLAPTRLFSAGDLPEPTVKALMHLYERFDGEGFPGRLAGREIPLPARLLAIVESFSDLTHHEKNPYRRRLTAEEACDALAQLGDVFDTQLVDLLEREILGDDLRRRLLDDRCVVLVIDADAEEGTLIEMRLAEAGHEARVRRTLPDSPEILRDVDIVVCDTHLPGAPDFAIPEMIRRLGLKLPTILLSPREDRETLERGLSYKPADFRVKPVSAEVITAKVLQLVSERHSDTGVRGSLEQMSLSDVVQVLSSGRKTGTLELSSHGAAGSIDFATGAIVDAAFGARRGADAFYALLRLSTGEFSLKTVRTNDVQTIHESVESLLLEGMRRLDEGIQ